MSECPECGFEGDSWDGEHFETKRACAECRWMRLVCQECGHEFSEVLD